LQHKVKELTTRLEENDMAVILETGTNGMRTSEAGHDEYVIDREYKTSKGNDGKKTLH